MSDPAYTLTAHLCAVAVVGEIDGYEVIRRDSVVDLVSRWRAQKDAQGRAKADEIAKLRDELRVYKDALWKACGDDEKLVDATLESQR